MKITFVVSLGLTVSLVFVTGCGKSALRAAHDGADGEVTATAPEDAETVVSAETATETETVSAKLAAAAVQDAPEDSPPAKEETPATPQVVVRNIVSDLYVEIAKGSTANDAVVDQWSRIVNLKPDYQKWKLVAVRDKAGAIVGRNFVNLKSGKCLTPIASNKDSGMVQRECSGGDDQTFQLTMLGQFYRLKNKASQRCLAIPAGKNIGAGAPIVQALCNNGDIKQRWQMQ